VVNPCVQIRARIVIATSDRDAICVDDMIELRVFVCLLMVSACAGAPEVASGEQGSGGGVCHSSICNSDEVMHYGVWEANLWGRRDVNGIHLRTTETGRAAIYKEDTAYDLHVEKGKISGTHAVHGTISGKDLVGMRIELLQEDEPYYNITIKHVGDGVAFEAAPNDGVETYTMVWHDGVSADNGKAVCNSIGGNGPDEKLFHLFGMLPTETVAFEGDRFDPYAMTTAAKADNDWFNFGCAGHTLAKLYLLRYTVNTMQVDDWAQRQTMLKMFVGDYCGSGKTFTRAFEPIGWKGGHHPNYDPLVQFTTDPNDHPLDARWNPKGAACVRNPRMQWSTHADWSAEFTNPDALTRIRDACHWLPICDNNDPEDLAGALVVSANRLPL
jgi:hypothetical protein